VDRDDGVNPRLEIDGREIFLCATGNVALLVGRWFRPASRTPCILALPENPSAPRNARTILVATSPKKRANAKARGIARLS
jgi:hypothetical protein